MKWIEKNIFWIIYTVIICVFSIILASKNYKSYGFWRADAVDIITFVIAGIIVFLVAERDRRNKRRNDCIEHVIDEIEAYISNDQLFQISDVTLIKQASCANRIKYLKDANFHDIQNEINFIEDRFNEIRDLYSYHCQSPEDLGIVKKDIDRHRTTIIDKCNKIRIELYK